MPFLLKTEPYQSVVDKVDIQKKKKSLEGEKCFGHLTPYFKIVY